jgi:hypothetical protein
MQRTK